MNKEKNNKNDPGVGGENAIREAIRMIALEGIADPNNGIVYGSRRITGYVAKINDNLTVDVQEYLDESDFNGERIGYHEGVYLSSIESNPNGYVIVPKLYSDVIIVKDPATGNEYVSMYSHVGVIQLESSGTASIGVVDREALDLDGDGTPDVDGLEPTGLSGRTAYAKDEVRTEVADENGGRASFVDVKAGSIDISVSDGDASTAHLDGSSIAMEIGKSKTTLDNGANVMENGGELVKVTSSGVFVGSDSGTSHAALGEELADVLTQILNCISSIKTPPVSGYMLDPASKAAVAALIAKIKSYKATKSGFISRKVNIQK